MQRKKSNSPLLDRRAISPLIATVLIIGFTVSLTAVVMTWGKNFITEKTQKTSADAEVQMRCINMEFTIDKACIRTNLNDKTVELTLRNLKSEKIDAFRFRSTSMPNVLEDLKALDVFNSESLTLSVSKSLTLNTIDIVPLVKGASEYTPCAIQTKTARLDPCAP